VKARLDILILDDDDDIAEVISLILLDRGHAVRVALDLETARRELERRAPDVLLCDYSLGGRSSDELLAWVHATRPEIYRVLYSGMPAESWSHLVVAGLVHHALSKPASLSSLCSALKA
jgi:DNA-binding NtrC family response regulator